jgi:arylsulfate sulfotransferase
MLFDNGNQRRRPFEERPDENYSRAVEYAIDDERMTVSEIWSYGGHGDEVFFSAALGDVDWLPKTGNVLLTDGFRFTSSLPRVRFARIVEVTHTNPALKVFELIIGNAGPQSGWHVYRSERLASLYFTNP